ncbi:hypothetical protein D2962_13325 [Biomaibacter acetigenes]|uniref:Uncharacterized protein n=1 Tax=Biomaibacter acetigenes TaxID=2316383 RepID=A0A3G2R7N1_9FIRM|nr:hypothetical protein [Biomaibacter acetigenes]AYO31446.1 hypothetical protein D2962_13325 [Biomaibacter acetigenes]
MPNKILKKMPTKNETNNAARPEMITAIIKTNDIMNLKNRFLMILGVEKKPATTKDNGPKTCIVTPAEPEVKTAFGSLISQFKACGPYNKNIIKKSGTDMAPINEKEKKVLKIN